MNAKAKPKKTPASIFADRRQNNERVVAINERRKNPFGQDQDWYLKATTLTGAK